MENEKVTRINEFLARHGASVATISKQKLAQFEKVDDAIQARLVEINKAREILSGRPINVSVIAADTGIARKTFYNNDLLRLFVEEHSSSSDDKTASVGDIERLRAKYEELERQVHQFLLRDIETESLRYENRKLMAEVENYRNRNENLERQYETMQKENARLRQGQAGKVIQMKGVDHK